MNYKDDLISISQDLTETLIPSQEEFFRHYIVHEKG